MTVQTLPAADKDVVADPAPAYQDWRECEQCGLVSALPPMQPDLVADCPRCSHPIWRMRRHAFELPLAWALSALMFYVFALCAPFLEITAYGRFQLADLETGPLQLTLQGFEWVGILVLAVTIIFPGIKIGIALVTLLGLKTKLLPVGFLKGMFRWYGPIGPWAMIDVYLLGFLVAYTRLSAIASVHLDTALFSLIGLMIAMAACDAALDSEAVWRALDEQAHPAASSAPDPPGQLVGCHRCGMMNASRMKADDTNARMLDPGGERCRRCHAKLRHRKPDSIARAWALIISAVLLYIPANIYPVMLITKIGNTHAFTIMGGIVELAEYGLWPLALLVFLASITIPLMKLLILGYMLVVTKNGSDEHLIGRIKAYRLIDFIGRWSMIDVFMVSILVALVRFGQFANIQADMGAPCFAAVVVLTMFAVNCFDPRLMWDAVSPPRTPGEYKTPLITT